jgi:aerobic-type carbon monoxide dehydrogenase small subunit (CoxS/CutS family)
MTDQSHAGPPDHGSHGNSGAWQPVPGGGDYDPDQTMHVSFAAQLPPEPRPGEDPLGAHGPAGPGPRTAGDPATTWTIPVIRDEQEPDSGDYSVGAFTSSWDQAPSPAAPTTQSFPAGMFGQGAAAAQAARASAAEAAQAAPADRSADPSGRQPPAPAGSGQWAMPFGGPQAGGAAPWQPAHAPAADAAWTGPAEDPERPAGDAPAYGHPRDDRAANGLPPAGPGYPQAPAPAAYGTGSPAADPGYAPGAGDPHGTAYAPADPDGRGEPYGSDGRGTVYGSDGRDAHRTSYGQDGPDGGRGGPHGQDGTDGRGTSYPQDGTGGRAGDGSAYPQDGTDGRGTSYAPEGGGYGAGGPRAADDGHAYAASDAAASGSDGFGAAEPSGGAAPQPLPEAQPRQDTAPGDAPGGHDADPEAAGPADAAGTDDPADTAGAATATGATDAEISADDAALLETDPADDALLRADPDAEREREPDPEPAAESRSEHPLASYTLRVNGTERPVTDAWLGESLLYVLRERLGLAGAKDGCEQGECGACSVKVDGRLVASCLVPAATAAGAEVRTVEGLAVDGRPSDVQQALADCGAVQCGFCVPGMAMTVHDLLEGNHRPSDLEVRQALSGNLCRCSGYRGVLDAVRQVVADRAAEDDADTAEDAARVPHQGGPAGPEGAR